MSDDVVYFVSNGSVATMKHTLMGCGLHSMTGQKKPVQVMNKMNNSCTYDFVREVETAQAELAQELSEKQFPLPLVPKNDSSSVLVRFWWDNFDATKENKEGSIHTCHGVAYTEPSADTKERSADIQIPKSKRRSLSTSEVNLPSKTVDPHKRPPIFEKSGDDIYKNTYASALPLMWKTQRGLCSLDQTVSYRFVGWVSSTFKVIDSLRTVITFLPPIRNPITQFSTVIECIYQSLKYAKSSNMKYVHITADCGAACKFYQVVWNNQQEFKNVIIHLGDFHAMQELFGVIGKIVTGSGFEDVLYQADLCTSGGIKGVVSGKHYNRSWSVHECLSEALHRLFMEKESESLSINSELAEMIKNVSDSASCKQLYDHPDFQHFALQFEQLQQEYLSGKKGKTAQYWMFYLSLVQVAHEFHYSINMNDFYLRKECWKKLVLLCFPTNKRNYARYGSYYLKQLENLPSTHPGAVEELLEKGVSVRRNGIGIGQSIDGAGEQTFMRSAKTSGGIKGFTSNDATYDKWVLSRPFQAKYVEALLEMIGIADKDSHTKCLRKTEITKSEKRIVKLKDIFNNTFLNPFDSDLDVDKLYNIASGSPVSEDASECLLTIGKRSKELHDEFNTRMMEGSEKHFWDPIKVQDWKDFSVNDKKTKIKTLNGKAVEIKVQRDVLGFLLAKSQELKSPINIDEALKHPLCLVPLSIAHGDGTKRKTNKSSLLNIAIEPSVLPCEEPVNGEKAYVLDLAALLRSTVKIPDTFEELALKILRDIPGTYNYIFVACDTYRNVSIKAQERKLRGASNKLLIRSGKVKIPPNFQKFLCNGDNKERLFKIIEDTWKNSKELVGERIIYFARGNECVEITNEGASHIESLETDHEEADTKISYLIKHAIDSYPDLKGVSIRSSSGDVDIPVILLGSFGSHSSTSITLDNGTGKNRKRIRIDSSRLTSLQQQALVGFHAFTGNDYVSSFLRKTKKTWIKVLEDSESLNFFAQLGNNSFTDELFHEAEKFVCKLYGDRHCESVDELRAKIFWKRLRKDGKVVDLSLLPPCSSTLWKHTARAHFIAKMWKLASYPLQHLDSFADNGWFADGSIDWIKCPFPSDIVTLFCENEASSPGGDADAQEDFEDDNGDDGDESDIEEECDVC